VVVTGDHGEELWDRGLYGHAAPTLTNARILVPLVMHVPGETREVPLSAHADLMPTIVEALRLDPPVAPAIWSTGESLLSAPAGRRILVHASGYPYGDRGARVVCAVDGERKLRLRREPGRVPRFTLVSATDLDDEPAPAGDLTALEDELARQSLRFIR
jgi:arylsulfatase A-like enzyme